MTETMAPLRRICLPNNINAKMQSNKVLGMYGFRHFATKTTTTTKYVKATSIFAINAENEMKHFSL